MVELFALLKTPMDEKALIVWLKVNKKIIYFDYLPSNHPKYHYGQFESIDEALNRLKTMTQHEWWKLVDGTAKDLLKRKPKKEIKIVVKGGVVTEVKGLPKGYDYKVIDKDVFE